MAISRWKIKMHTHAVVGRQVRAFRAQHGISQRAVAKVVRCHPTAISSLELGKCGSMELLEAVLWALGLDFSDIQSQQKVRKGRAL